MDWTANITSVQNDPTLPQTIDVLVDYTDGTQTVSEKYTYTSVNLTDASQVNDQIQARLGAFNAFDSIVSQLTTQVGQRVELSQDVQRIDNHAVSIDVSKEVNE